MKCGGVLGFLCSCVKIQNQQDLKVLVCRKIRMSVRWDILYKDLKLKTCVIGFERTLIPYTIFYHLLHVKISANAFSIARGICFWAALTNFSQNVWHILLLLSFFFLQILVSQSINITIGKHRLKLFLCMTYHAIFKSRFLFGVVSKSLNCCVFEMGICFANTLLCYDLRCHDNHSTAHVSLCVRQCLDSKFYYKRNISSGGKCCNCPAVWTTLVTWSGTWPSASY